MAKTVAYPVTHVEGVDFACQEAAVLEIYVVDVIGMDEGLELFVDGLVDVETEYSGRGLAHLPDSSIAIDHRDDVRTGTDDRVQQALSFDEGALYLLSLGDVGRDPRHSYDGPAVVAQWEPNCHDRPGVTFPVDLVVPGVGTPFLDDDPIYVSLGLDTRSRSPDLLSRLADDLFGGKSERMQERFVDEDITARQILYEDGGRRVLQDGLDQVLTLAHGVHGRSPRRDVSSRAISMASDWIQSTRPLEPTPGSVL